MIKEPRKLLYSFKFLLLYIYSTVLITVKIFTFESVKYIFGNLPPRNDIQNLNVGRDLFIEHQQ